MQWHYWYYFWWDVSVAIVRIRYGTMLNEYGVACVIATACYPSFSLDRSRY